MMKRTVFVVVAAVAGMGIAACHAGNQVAAREVPTHSVEYLAYNMERHKGETVRTCGALVEQSGTWLVEDAPSRQLGTLHGRPAVLIAACRGRRPALDGARCITGRIARRDGSLAYPSGSAVAVDDVPINYEWFIHPRCSASR